MTNFCHERLKLPAAESMPCGT